MICKKCDGQGVITKITQRGEDGIWVMAALLTYGLSLPFTTTTREVTCPRCHGLGRVGA